MNFDIILVSDLFKQLVVYSVYMQFDLAIALVILIFSTTPVLQDYEYASYNPVAFDIANHFCEMAADYHTETPHILDYSKYPGRQPVDLFSTFYASFTAIDPSCSYWKFILNDNLT